MTRRALVGLVVLVAAGASGADPAPRKILVLPLGGPADAPTRSALDTSLARLAHGLGGTVTTGDTTFDETAAAVGCSPEQEECPETVRTTLGVDELVFGSAGTHDGQTIVIVHRISGSSPPRESTVTAASPAAAETALTPLFTEPKEAPPQPLPPGPPEDHHRRNIGIAYVAGGGAALIVGLALWSTASHRQDDIDAARPETAQDFAALEALESRAMKYAVIGDIFVIGGLALGTYGTWVLYKDHKARRLAVVPVAQPDRAGLSLEGSW